MSDLLRTVLLSSAILLALGAVFGMMLGYFSKVMAVNEDPRIAKIAELLPGANCGACGYAGCANLAENLVAGKAPLDKCKQMGNGSAEEIAKILGIEIDANSFIKKVAVIRCQGNYDNVVRQVNLQGVTSCKIASTLKTFEKSCLFSCIGYGDCAEKCPFSAITLNDSGIPLISPLICTGCGICVEVCPKKVIELLPYQKQVLTLCMNTSKGKEVKDVCKAGCFSCQLCVKKCPKNAIQMNNNLPVIDRTLCDLCGICVEVCPAHSIRMIHEA